MNLVVDANLSPRLADLLTAAGHEAIHVRTLGLNRASDSTILDRAAELDAVVVSEDTDFSALLAHRGSPTPSLILLRSADPLTVDQQAALILDGLSAARHDLDQGAILVLGRGRARVRSLPIDPDK